MKEISHKKYIVYEFESMQNYCWLFLRRKEVITGKRREHVTCREREICDFLIWVVINSSNFMRNQFAHFASMHISVKYN